MNPHLASPGIVKLVCGSECDSALPPLDVLPCRPSAARLCSLQERQRLKTPQSCLQGRHAACSFTSIALQPFHARDSSIQALACLERCRGMRPREGATRRLRRKPQVCCDPRIDCDSSAAFAVRMTCLHRLHCHGREDWLVCFATVETTVALSLGASVRWSTNCLTPLRHFLQPRQNRRVGISTRLQCKTRSLPIGYCSTNCTRAVIGYWIRMLGTFAVSRSLFVLLHLRA